MASAAKRRSARKREPTSRQLSTLDVARSSPSRPAKRRKRAIKPAPQLHDPDTDDAMNEDEQDSDDGNDAASLTEAADLVIPFLNGANYTILASLEFPNSDASTITAYAKIAGKTWTYYVKSSSINIGRAPEKSVQADLESNMNGSEEQAQKGEDIHIDLGPSKHVSRLHATVFYDDHWLVQCKGRNGIRVNGLLLRRGNAQQLNSGDVLEVAGTEMIFVCPDVPAIVQEMYTDRIKGIRTSEVQNRAQPQSHGHPSALLDELTQAQSSALALDYKSPFHVSPYAPPGAIQSATTPRPVTPPANHILSLPYLSQNNVTTPTNDGSTVMGQGEQLDYSSDAAKDIKPPMSYATLIAQAILSTAGERLSLNGIYEWIKAHFAYYRHIEQGWQNSIRHNLSLNTSFAKTARQAHEPGKGCLWVIVDDKKEDFRKQGLKLTSRGGARQSSNPNTPAPRRSPKGKTPPTRELADAQTLKHSPSSHSPPLASYPHNNQETETPSRPPRTHGLARNDLQTLPRLSDNASPLPHRAPYLSQNAGSPPTLSSTAYYNADGSQYNSLYTPAPQRHVPQINAPSTVKLPSQWLPQSSPAPFWRGEFSTPAKLPDTSPAKANGEGPVEAAQSSSPPPAVGAGSPTRVRGAPYEKRVNGLSGNLSRAKPSLEQEEEDEPLDLMGSFPPIGERLVSGTAR